MRIESILLLVTSLTASAYAGEEWPAVGALKVGKTFKYPILGIPGAEVRPTQAAFGARALEEKVKGMAKLSKDELKDALEHDPIPVVSAPDGRLYMIDHHHQALAAIDPRVGRKNAFFFLHTDLSKAPGGMDEFWAELKRRHWVREFDHLGRPIKIPRGLPTTIFGMLDDPFRSLAWFVRKMGGYRKSNVEYAEFLWADFFRPRVDLGKTDADFLEATKKSEKMAHFPEANTLPGWDAKTVNCNSHLH